MVTLSKIEKRGKDRDMGKRRLAVIIASFCTVLVGFAVRTGYGVLLPEMLPSLRISKAEAGLIYGSFFIAYTIFSPVLGLLADRINIRSLLPMFLVTLGIGTLLMGYSSSLLDATFFFILAGIGSSACWSPVVPLVQRWTSDRKKGMTLAFVDVGASVGVALTSLVIPLIVVAYDWRMGWKSLGALALIVAGINFLLVRDWPTEMTKLHDRELRGSLKKASHRISGKILRDGKFLLIGTSYLLVGFSVLIPLTFISTYAVQELTFRYEVATRVITTIAVSSIVGKLVLGHLSDTLGRIRTIIVCQTLIAIGNLGIVCFPELLPLNLSMAIFGFGHGAVWPLYALCAPDYFSKSSAGFIVGFWTLFLGIGFILSPIIAGWIADTTGRFMWSFVLAIAAAIISMFLMLLVGKKISCGNPPIAVPLYTRLDE
jgi:sugar phosphate permease